MPTHAPFDTHERQLLEFTPAWVPYGGPPEDLSYLEFGTTSAAVEDRFCSLVAAHAERLPCLPRADRALLADALASVGA
ncbi:MAG: hypothetical protein WBB07_24440 [Mycobacterium sp.]